MGRMLSLLGFLILAAPAWSADNTNTPPAEKPAGQTAPGGGTTAGATPDSTTASCPTSCVMMTCPPPNGPAKLCCPVSPYTQTCP